MIKKILKAFFEDVFAHPINETKQIVSGIKQDIKQEGNILKYSWKRWRKNRVKKAEKRKRKRRFPIISVSFILILIVLHFIPIGSLPTVAAATLQAKSSNSATQAATPTDDSPTVCANIDPQAVWCKHEYATQDDCNRIDPLDTWCHPLAGTGYSWAFPCAGTPGDDSLDWLAGFPARFPGGIYAGHIAHTYPIDTYAQGAVTTLQQDMVWVSFMLLVPVVILIGYQLMLSATTFRHAGALEALSQTLLGALAIALSFQLSRMMIDLTNTLSNAMVFLHIYMPYPTHIGSFQTSFSLAGDGSYSFGGIVMPMNRWGCAANDFVRILSGKIISDVLAAALPIFSGLIKLADSIATITEVIQHFGEFVQLILSIMFFAQVFVRLILINYYIITAPLVFACWALPGGMGKRVVRQWFQGFCSVLIVQTVQLFVMATLPLILPPLPSLPSDSIGIMSTIFAQLPPLLVLMITLRVPKAMGTSATRAIAAAGSVAGGAVSAAGLALYNLV